MGHDGCVGLGSTSGAATADADRGRCGREGRAGGWDFGTAGALLTGFRRRKRLLKAFLNCSNVSEEAAEEGIVSWIAPEQARCDSTDILTCSWHYVTHGGALGVRKTRRGSPNQPRQIKDCDSLYQKKRKNESERTMHSLCGLNSGRKEWRYVHGRLFSSCLAQMRTRRL